MFYNIEPLARGCNSVIGILLKLDCFVRKLKIYIVEKRDSLNWLDYGGRLHLALLVLVSQCLSIKAITVILISRLILIFTQNSKSFGFHQFFGNISLRFVWHLLFLFFSLF